MTPLRLKQWAPDGQTVSLHEGDEVIERRVSLFVAICGEPLCMITSGSISHSATLAVSLVISALNAEGYAYIQGCYLVNF